MCDAKAKYYAAYDERYKTAHRLGVSWASDQSTPIVMETVRRYGIRPDQSILEVGCGEGRDARTVLGCGYDLTAVDLSGEAIAYCRKMMPEFAGRFLCVDCVNGKLDRRFDFIYAVAVIHMLVLDEDRAGFYQFIRDHMSGNGLALICTMGDGEMEMQTDIGKAFELQERNHESGKMTVAATSCRMVSFQNFENELEKSGFEIVEKGITGALPDFDRLMYAVVKI